MGKVAVTRERGTESRERAEVGVQHTEGYDRSDHRDESRADSRKHGGHQIEQDDREHDDRPARATEDRDDRRCAENGDHRRSHTDAEGERVAGHPRRGAAEREPHESGDAARTRIPRRERGNTERGALQQSDSTLERWGGCDGGSSGGSSGRCCV